MFRKLTIIFAIFFVTIISNEEIKINDSLENNQSSKSFFPNLTSSINQTELIPDIYNLDINETLNPFEFDLKADTKLVLDSISNGCYQSIKKTEKLCFKSYLSNFDDISKNVVTNDMDSNFERKAIYS